ncbi:MAG: SIS domain-containing protein [Planctomycetes bacterium]|nr:SIS domain-containing protein [Planctomycetota bacterium]MCB9830707.1 SIS domain-containing protein [Planctomycetota bacterium]MCB9902684.1 SIS domain-containing protein [Planctomycetota bacterium]
MTRHRPSEALVDLERVLKRLKAREIAAFERELLEAQRVFVTGLGRTGLMARGFAMRLMHLGRTVFHVGDVITPAIGADDLLVICTRTGRSKVLGYYIDIARKAKARVAVVTARGSAPVGRRADVVLTIDDRPAARRRAAPLLPLGSLFEQALLVTLDHVVVDLMAELDLSEEDLARIHTGFE